jgi:signal transduction histidine kinase
MSSNTGGVRLRDRIAGASEWVHNWVRRPAPALELRAGPSPSLEEAFARLQEELTPRMRFCIFVSGQPTPLRTEVQEQVYLMGREALVNALRHSQATSVEAEVEYSPARLRVLIRDNGCGMDPQTVRSRPDAHWGLVGMSERAASIGACLRLSSRPGLGTEVEISVPNRIAFPNGGNSSKPGRDSDRLTKKFSGALRHSETISC